jgi:hypothetical protein
MNIRPVWLTALLLLASSLPTLAAAPKAPKPHAEWRAGYEYSVVIPWELPDNIPAGKVEVRELFLYTSGWSKTMQAHLQKWLDANSAHISFIREPAIAYPHAREQARMYYTLKEMGHEDLHVKFFDFVREDHRYDIYHTIRHPAKEAILDMNIVFAKRNGLETKAFTDTYLSRDIDNQVIEAEIDSAGSMLSGTSTLIINNHYSTSLQRFMGADPGSADRTPDAADYERFFQLIDQLVALAEKEPPPGPSAAPTAPKP